MQILHIDTGREMRGGQYQVMLLMKGLREKGHHSILLARSESPLWKAAEAEGFEVQPAIAREVWKRSSWGAIVHAHDARAHSLAALTSRARFVVSRRVAFPVKKSMISKWKYTRAARYLAISRFAGAELEIAGVNKRKIDIVYDGTEPRRPAGWSAEYPLVALASNDPGKLSQLAAEAAALAGSQMIYSTNLVESLQRCSALLYLSRSEGLGSAALLAMSMGVPVIASKVGGLAEVFVDEISGLYVRNESGEVARAIRRLLSSPALAETLRVGGMARVAECFTDQHLVAGTLTSYERALAG